MWDFIWWYHSLIEQQRLRSRGADGKTSRLSNGYRTTKLLQSIRTMVWDTERHRLAGIIHGDKLQGYYCADIDALPVHEHNTADYKSGNWRKTRLWLWSYIISIGAKMLMSMKDRISWRRIFSLQPAEEMSGNEASTWRLHDSVDAIWRPRGSIYQQDSISVEEGPHGCAAIINGRQTRPWYSHTGDWCTVASYRHELQTVVSRNEAQDFLYSLLVHLPGSEWNVIPRS